MASTERLTPAGRRALDAASQLFYDRGIHAIGVEAIAAAAGITKKTLYACFGSKDHLVAAYLREREERWRDWLTGWVDRRAGSPRDQLLATFDALGTWIETQGHRGCGFLNALAELPDPDHPGRAVVVDQKAWMLDYLTDLAERAGLADPRRVASNLFLLHEGVAVSVSTGCLPDAVADARAAAMAVMDAAEH